MRLREKDLVTLLDLVKIGKRIQRIYKDLERGDSIDRCSRVLLRLIDREAEILYSFEIDKEKLKDIEDWYNTKVHINFDTQLLLGTKEELTDDNYPYFRIIARLRYVLSKQSTGIKNIMDAYATDLETELLYYTLDRESKRFFNCKTANLNDTITKIAVSNSFISSAHKVLIDSIETETKILKNAMKPTEVVYDCIDFHSDIISCSSYRDLKECDEESYDYFIDEMNLNDRERSNNAFRIPRFNERYGELMKSLIIQVMRERDKARESTLFLKRVAYVKVLIATLKRNKREEVYRGILSFSKVRNSKLVWLIPWLIDQFQDVEKNLVSHTRNVALMPYFGAK